MTAQIEIAKEPEFFIISGIASEGYVWVGHCADWTPAQSQTQTGENDMALTPQLIEKVRMIAACPNCLREFSAQVKDEYCPECWRAWLTDPTSKKFEARRVDPLKALRDAIPNKRQQP